MCTSYDRDRDPQQQHTRLCGDHLGERGAREEERYATACATYSAATAYGSPSKRSRRTSRRSRPCRAECKTDAARYALFGRGVYGHALSFASRSASHTRPTCSADTASRGTSITPTTSQREPCLDNTRTSHADSAHERRSTTLRESLRLRHVNSHRTEQSRSSIWWHVAWTPNETYRPSALHVSRKNGYAACVIGDPQLAFPRNAIAPGHEFTIAADDIVLRRRNWLCGVMPNEACTGQAALNARTNLFNRRRFSSVQSGGLPCVAHLFDERAPPAALFTGGHCGGGPPAAAPANACANHNTIAACAQSAAPTKVALVPVHNPSAAKWFLWEPASHAK